MNGEEVPPMRKHSFFVLWIVLVMLVSMSAASALDKSTLYNGCKGEEVKKLQQALIDLGYLGGYADGVFGRNTENAVRKFQSKNHLNSDGLAGKKTQEILFAKASSSSSSSSAKSASSSSSASSSASSASSGVNGSLFGGDYATIRIGAKGARVTSLQKALSAVGAYSGSIDGKFGSGTQEAVKLFQKSEKLTSDGLAGKKTLQALEKAVSSGKKIKASASSGSASSSSSSSGSSSSTVSGPDSSSVRLLHWYNDVKPSISNGQHLQIYDPSTKSSWTLKILSRGRHCDAEPLTREDTDTMVKAFGGVYTWDVKKVYVRLPNGTWTIGTTHDHPHDANTIKDNGFDGHLCVHFLRNMAETEELDPNYGVTNQKAIRSFWKSLSGEDIDI